MRLVLVAVLTIGLLVGTKWFLGANASQHNHDHAGVLLIQASGEYTVDVTLTFDAGPDEFSLEDVGDAPSLVVQMNGGEVLRRTETILAAESPLQIPAIEGVIVGTNEFFVQASPSDMSSLQPLSARVRIQRDGNVVADQTIWSEGGDILQGTVSLEVTEP